MESKGSMLSIGKVKLMGIGLAAMLVMGSPVSTFADANLEKTNELEVIIDAGEIGNKGFNLEVPSVNSADNIKIADKTKTHTTSFDGDFKVSDLRGVHIGWDLNVYADPLKELSGNTLSEGSLSLEEPNKIEGNGTVPSITNGTQVIDRDQVRVVQAKDEEGAGVFDIGFSEDALKINIDPSEARVGKYETTLNWSLSSTPNPS